MSGLPEYYTPLALQNGQVLTAEDITHIENGIFIAYDAKHKFSIEVVEQSAGNYTTNAVFSDIVDAYNNGYDIECIVIPATAGTAQAFALFSLNQIVKMDGEIFGFAFCNFMDSRPIGQILFSTLGILSDGSITMQTSSIDYPIEE